MKTIHLLTPLILAGCSAQEGTQGQIPGADVQNVNRGVVGALAEQAAKPCGYQLMYDSTLNGQPVLHHNWTVSITYDAAGLDVAEHGIDESGVTVLEHSTEYDATGNFVMRTEAEEDFPTQTWWAVYDSFGRIVRYSNDSTGDGVEDTIETFDYGLQSIVLGHDETGPIIDWWGGDGKLATMHVTEPTRSYDDLCYYRVDDENRIGDITRDDHRPEDRVHPIADEFTGYEYDEEGRVASWSTCSPGATHLFDPNTLLSCTTETGKKSYDGDDRLLTNNWSSYNIPGYWEIDHKETHTYGSDSEVSFTVEEKKQVGDSAGDLITTSKRVAWKYDHCQ